VVAVILMMVMAAAMIVVAGKIWCRMSDDDTSKKMQRQLLRAIGRRRLREIRAHVERDLREIGLDDVGDFFDLMRNRPEPTWRWPTHH